MLKKHFFLYQMFKTVVLPNIFVETMIYIYFQDSLMNAKKNKKLLFQNFRNRVKLYVFNRTSNASNINDFLK